MPDPTPSIFNQNLDPNIANHQPLTPLTFLEWSATVYPDKVAVIYGNAEYTYREFARRCRLLRLRPIKAGHRARRHRRPHGPQHPPDA